MATILKTALFLQWISTLKYSSQYIYRSKLWTSRVQWVVVSCSAVAGGGAEWRTDQTLDRLTLDWAPGPPAAGCRASSFLPRPAVRLVRHSNMCRGGQFTVQYTRTLHRVEGIPVNIGNLKHILLSNSVVHWGQNYHGVHLAPTFPYVHLILKLYLKGESP